MPHVSAAPFAGLAVAWGGTMLLISPPAGRLFDNPSNLPMAFAGQALLWALAAAVVAIVMLWERQPLASLWLRPFRPQSIAWGIALAVVHYTAVFPFTEWVRQRAGLSGFSEGMSQVMAFPLSYRIVAVIGAGIVEELLFRAYTVTRIAALTGNVWLAGSLALIGFSALHLPGWGWGFTISGLIGGVVPMAFFLWKRDLVSMIAFHLITDAVGIVIAPVWSEWWTQPP